MADEHRSTALADRVRRRPMIALAVVVLLIVVVVGAGIVIVANPFGSKAPTASQQTTWQAITGRIRDGKPSRDVALQAFAYVYKVNIPGVQVPVGTPGTDVPQSGTLVTRWVQQNWDQLTPDQQAAINPYLQPGPNDTVLNIDLPSAGGTTRAGQRPRPPALAAITDREQMPVAHGPQAKTGDAPSDALQEAFKNELLTDIAHIGQRLGLPTISEGFGLWTKVTIDLSETDGGNTLFTTYAAQNGAGVFSPCNVTAWHNAWEGEQPNGSTLSARLHVLVTHEVVHCYQNTIWGSVAASKAMPAWITEGTALWLAADDTQQLESMVPSQWRDGYFKYPERPLTNRTYDAYGYFALLDHEGRGLWSHMVQAWQAAAAAQAASGQNISDSFIGVLDGDGTDVRNAWAPSYLRQSGWGDPWVAYGFGLPDDAQVLRRPISALPAPGYLGEQDSRSNTVDEVQDSAGEIVVVNTNGIASARDSAGHSYLAFESGRFCIQGDCICPANTQRAGEKMADQKIEMPFVLAFNAPEGGAKYQVVGRKLEDECGKQKNDEPWTPPNNPGGGDPPCGSGCGGSNGDPHLRTVNNVYYDFQAAGEFTLLRSPDGSVDIQARQEPYSSSDHVSINTAVVALDNGHKVGVYSNGHSLVAHVDGKIVDASTPIDLGNGAQISQHERGFELDFPDGTQLWALSLGEYGINAQVRPSEGLRGSGLGILGPVAPGGLGVPLLPDGTRLPRTSDAHQKFQLTYHDFANAWRITDKSSLFDYDAGKSTASYTNAAFPNEQSVVIPAQLTDTQRSQAAGPCASVTDLGLLEQCLFDVSITGDSGFAAGYGLVQGLVTTGTDVLNNGPSPSPSPTPGPAGSPEPPGTTAPIPANALLTGMDSLKGSAVGPDGTLYVSVGYPDETFKLVAINPSSGQIVKEVASHGGGQVAVAAGSVWVGEFTGGTDCSTTRLDAVTLTVQATIPTPCDFFGTTLASTGDAAWFIDRTLESYAKDGLRRIDPATNIPGDPVILPFFNGFLSGTPTGLIYGDEGTDKAWYRLPVGQTQLQSLGARQAPVFAAGAGIWDQNEAVAEFFNGEGPAAQTIPIDGPLVGADDQAVYVEQTSSVDSSSELWRYPADGSNPVLAATPPETYGDREFSYFDNDPLLVSPGGLVKIWVRQATSTSASALFVQWIPTT